MSFNRTLEIPSMDLLEKIIIDDKCFHEFANSHDEIIYGFKKEEILTHLNHYIRTNLNNKNVSDKFITRAKYYNDKFNLDIPKFRNVNDGINKDLEAYALNGKENYNNPLVQARAIYLNLAKALCYDEHVPAYNQDLNNLIMQDIYYTKSSDVTLQNNKVTCILWANIYAELLKKVGINAVVVGSGKHKKVEFTIEGVAYSADATNSFFDKDNLYLNDLTRIKLNSPTEGFSGANEIDDEIINFKPKSLIEQYHEYSNNHAALSNMRLTTGSPETDLIVSKLDYLSTMAYQLPQIEAIGYLHQMLRNPNSIITSDELKKVTPCQIRLIDENNLIYTSLVITIKNGDEYIYKLLNIPEGLITVNKEYFENLIKDGKMINDGNLLMIGNLKR